MRSTRCGPSCRPFPFTEWRLSDGRTCRPPISPSSLLPTTRVSSCVVSGAGRSEPAGGLCRHAALAKGWPGVCLLPHPPRRPASDPPPCLAPPAGHHHPLPPQPRFQVHLKVGGFHGPRHRLVHVLDRWALGCAWLRALLGRGLGVTGGGPAEPRAPRDSGACSGLHSRACTHGLDPLKRLDPLVAPRAHPAQAPGPTVAAAVPQSLLRLPRPWHLGPLLPRRHPFQGRQDARVQKGERSGVTRHAVPGDDAPGPAAAGSPSSGGACLGAGFATMRRSVVRH